MRIGLFISSTLNCMTPRGVYSSGEMRFMRLWQERKDAALYPLTNILHRLNVSPVLVSVVGIIVAGTSLWASFWYAQPRYFLLGLWAHVILDGVDGALARNHQRITSSGPLIDTAADYGVGIMALLLVARFTAVPLWLLVMVGVLYGLLLAVAYVRNERGVPYRLLPRGRLVFYLLLTIDIVAGTASLAWVLPLWIFVNGYLLVTGLYVLARVDR